jgi:hypothetical protein
MSEETAKRKDFEGFTVSQNRWSMVDCGVHTVRRGKARQGKVKGNDGTVR